MKIDINKPETEVKVGDILKDGENYYLVCKEHNFITNCKYFILNLTNSWTSSAYYDNIETLIGVINYDCLIKGKNLVLKLRED